MGFIKDLFQSVSDSRRKKQKEKQEKLNLRCDELISSVIKQSQKIDGIFRTEDEYIYNYDFDEQKSLMEKDRDRISKGIWSLRNANGIDILNRELKNFEEKIDAFKQNIEKSNIRVLDKKISKAYEQIGNIEERPLDYQQMSCIVLEPKNHLVVAGAGTGKTTNDSWKSKVFTSQ